MVNKDILQRFLFEQKTIRGEFIHLEKTYQAVLSQHDYPPPIRHLLGEALAIAGLLSAIIKFNGKLTLQFRGEGKLKFLLAQCDNQFNMRGLIKWEGVLNYDQWMEEFKKGVLVIMLDVGLKTFYQSIVAWSGDSLAEAIEGYFRDSEQIPTRLWLKVAKDTVTGVLLQSLPNSSNSQKESVQHDWEAVINLTHYLYAIDSTKMTQSELLRSLYPDEEIRIFSPFDIQFQCTCTRHRGEEALLLLGKVEAEKELNDNPTIVVTCDFCNKEYRYDRDDIKNLFDRHQGPSSSIH